MLDFVIYEKINCDFSNKKVTFMKKIILRILTVFILFNTFSCSNFKTDFTRGPSSKEEAILPEKMTDVEIAKLLLAIHKEIPELFADSARYDIDLFEILNDQANLQSNLIKMPHYLNLLNARRYAEIKGEISDESNGVVKTTQLKGETFNAWKDNLQTLANSLVKNKVDPISELKTMIGKIEKYSSNGFLNGLILNLPKELQDEARALHRSGDLSKLELFLNKNLASELKNFKSNPPVQNFAKEFLISKWKSLVLDEKRANSLMDLVIFMSNRNMDIHKFVHMISALDRQDFQSLTDPDFQEAALKKLSADANFKMPNFYKQFLKTQLSQVEVLETKIAEGYKLTIKEQNPLLSIFRGCTGGDCSSQRSFPYPNNPEERTFFVYGKGNKVKGYVNAIEIVGDDGKKHLYVNTISGSHINSLDTELIFRMLDLEKEKLGVSKIILPAEEVLDSLINFPPILQVFKKYVTGSKKVNINYQHQEIRTAIEKFVSDFNDGDYDHMLNNKTGTILSSEAHKFSEVKTEYNRVFSADLFHPNEKVDIMALLECVIALKSSERDHTSERIIHSLLSSDDSKIFYQFIELIWNDKQHLSSEIDKFLADFVHHFNLNQTVSDKIKVVFLSNAYLMASDAKSQHFYKANHEMMMADFKLNAAPRVLDRSEDVYDYWFEDIVKDPHFEEYRQAYLAELLKEDFTAEELDDDFVRYNIVLSTKLPKDFEMPYQTLVLVANKFYKNKEFLNLALDEAIKHHDKDFIYSITRFPFDRVYNADSKPFLKKLIKAGIDTGNAEFTYSVASILGKSYAAEWDDLFELVIDAAIKFKRNDALNSMLDYCLRSKTGIKFHRLGFKILKYAVEYKQKEILREFSMHAGVSRDYNKMPEWKDLYNISYTHRTDDDWNKMELMLKDYEQKWHGYKLLDSKNTCKQLMAPFI